MAQQIPNYRLIVRPIFVAFLLLGPFAPLPAMLLIPTLHHIIVAWHTRPFMIWWRAAVLVVTSLGLLAAYAIPSFLPRDDVTPNSLIEWLVASQLPFLASAACFSAMTMPLAICRFLRRHSDTAEVK